MVPTNLFQKISAVNILEKCRKVLINDASSYRDEHPNECNFCFSKQTKKKVVWARWFVMISSGIYVTFLR